MTRDEATEAKLEKSKRHYSAWVVNETIEEYSLRYAPRSFRRWSEFTVANTALGGISYLADFAIGGSIAISSGFAIVTKGKYYIARKDVHFHENPDITGLTGCSICGYEYEREDMAHCPVYAGAICSLCCSLDAQCHDTCKAVPT